MDIYEIVLKDGEILHCKNLDAAIMHVEAAQKRDDLRHFGAEDGDTYLQYNFQKRIWEIDCKINPEIMRYRVDYCINDIPGFSKFATYRAAKQKAQTADVSFSCGY